MTDARSSAPAEAAGGLVAFLDEARRRIDRRIAWPAAALLVVLTATNILLLLNLPAPGARPGLALLFAGQARVIGLFFFSVPVVRIMAASARPPWQLDGAFFLFYPVAMVSLALAAALAFAFTDPADPGDPVRIALRTATASLLVTPLAPWLVGIAAAVPIGLDFRRFLRNFSAWLPHLLVWLLLLVTPLAVAHASIDVALLQGRISWFWSAALLDGLLSVVVVLVTYALHAAAYRRVARS